MMMDWDKDIV